MCVKTKNRKSRTFLLPRQNTDFTKSKQKKYPETLPHISSENDARSMMKAKKQNKTHPENDVRFLLLIVFTHSEQTII